MVFRNGSDVIDMCVPSGGGFDQSCSGFTPQQKGDRLMLMLEIDDFRATIDKLRINDWRMWALTPSRYKKTKAYTS